MLVDGLRPDAGASRRRAAAADVRPAEWDKARAADLLRGAYWFGGIEPSLQQEILDRAEIITVKRRRALYHMGDKVTGMYAALEGDLRVYVNGENEERIFIRAIGPASWFGGSHLIDGSPLRTMEVYSATPSSLLFLSKRNFEELIENNNAALRAFTTLLCMDMAKLARLIIEARAEAPIRTARALVRFARAHGKPAAGGLEIGARLSQSDLASLVGVSRQYINGLIAEWEARGIVRWRSSGYHFVDAEKIWSMLTPLDRWIAESPGWI